MKSVGADIYFVKLVWLDLTVHVQNIYLLFCDDVIAAYPS